MMNPSYSVSTPALYKNPYPSTSTQGLYGRPFAFTSPSPSIKELLLDSNYYRLRSIFFSTYSPSSTLSENIERVSRLINIPIRLIQVGNGQNGKFTVRYQEHGGGSLATRPTESQVKEFFENKGALGYLEYFRSQRQMNFYDFSALRKGFNNPKGLAI